MLLQKVSHHLLLRPSVGQGQKKFLMAYLPKSGKLSDNESLRTMNLTARLQTYTVSHVKPYGVLFVLLVATHRHVFEQLSHVASTGNPYSSPLSGTIEYRWPKEPAQVG
jgi:hypothetical protein